MTTLKSVILFLSLVLITSCNTKDKNKTETITTKPTTTTPVVTLSKAQKLLNQTILAHGGDLYNTAHYAFSFRGIEYQLKTTERIIHTLKVTKKNQTVSKMY